MFGEEVLQDLLQMLLEFDLEESWEAAWVRNQIHEQENKRAEIFGGTHPPKILIRSIGFSKQQKDKKVNRLPKTPMQFVFLLRSDATDNTL